MEWNQVIDRFPSLLLVPVAPNRSFIDDFSEDSCGTIDRRRRRRRRRKLDSSKVMVMANTRPMTIGEGRNHGGWGSFPAGNEPSRNPHSAWTREIFILMVDITRILVTVETLRVRNSGRYHAPCGIYDIKGGVSRAQVFEIGNRSEPGRESTFLTYRPRVYMSNTNFPRLTIDLTRSNKKGLSPFFRLSIRFSCAYPLYS